MYNNIKSTHSILVEEISQLIAEYKIIAWERKNAQVKEAIRIRVKEIKAEILASEN